MNTILADVSQAAIAMPLWVQLIIAIAAVGTSILAIWKIIRVAGRLIYFVDTLMPVLEKIAENYKNPPSLDTTLKEMQGDLAQVKRDVAALMSKRTH